MRIERRGRNVHLEHRGPIVGTVRVPGSKSLTNRYLACAALAGGRTVLRGVSLSDDARAMLGGLERLGVGAEVDEARSEIRVAGQRGNFVTDEVELNAGNAGTAMRFLTALACLGHGRRRLDGSPRMRERPIGDLVAALQALGAHLGYEGRAGFPPLTVLAGGLEGGELVLERPPSSQFLSALVMVAPRALRDVLIRVEGELPSRPYLELTLDVLRSMGVETLAANGRIVIPALQEYRAGEYAIEPDASAATYFWGAAAVTGGRVCVAGLTRRSRQGDVRFVDVLGAMGCTVAERPEGLEVAGPVPGALAGIDVDLNEMPDTVQTLAAVALFARGPTIIRNVANLRIKETDRIAALTMELTRLGATVETRPDGLTIHPPATVRSAEIETYDDHRMALSFAVVGMGAGAIVIRDADVVSKSFPGFFDVLAALG